MHPRPAIILKAGLDESDACPRGGAYSFHNLSLSVSFFITDLANAASQIQKSVKSGFNSAWNSGACHWGRPWRGRWLAQPQKRGANAPESGFADRRTP